MQAKVLDKGHIVLPSSIRKKLGIKEGDHLTADVKGGNIVLSRQEKPTKLRKAQITKSRVTGLPVINVDKDAPPLTNEIVRDLLSDFP